MTNLIDKLSSDIELTIENLKNKNFKIDPLAGEHFSKIVSIMSSAYKRHGFILEKAILEQLKANPDFEVWEEKNFHVSKYADFFVNTIINNSPDKLDTESEYIEGERELQIDTIVYNKTNKQISAYEIKRGNGLHDSGKRRSMLRDLLCVKLLLKSYGIKKGFDVFSSESYIIFFYGQCSIPKPFSLTKDELDNHFGFSILKDVESLNDYFRKRLYELLTNNK